MDLLPAVPESIPAQMLTNNGTATDSVVFMITPTANGCNGPTVNYSIVVYPVPDVILPASQDICSGTSTVVANLTSMLLEPLIAGQLPPPLVLQGLQQVAPAIYRFKH